MASAWSLRNWKLFDLQTQLAGLQETLQIWFGNFGFGQVFYRESASSKLQCLHEVHTWNWKLFDLPTILQIRGADLAWLKRSFIQPCFLLSWITMSAWILRNWTQFNFQACLPKSVQLQTSESSAQPSSLIVLCNQFVAKLLFSLFSHIPEIKWMCQLTTSNQIVMNIITTIIIRMIISSWWWWYRQW